MFDVGTWRSWLLHPHCKRHTARMHAPPPVSNVCLVRRTLRFGAYRYRINWVRVSNEHSCSDRIFLGFYCSLDTGEGGYMYGTHCSCHVCVCVCASVCTQTVRRLCVSNTVEPLLLSLSCIEFHKQIMTRM